MKMQKPNMFILTIVLVCALWGDGTATAAATATATATAAITNDPQSSTELARNDAATAQTSSEIQIGIAEQLASPPPTAAGAGSTAATIVSGNGAGREISNAAREISAATEAGGGADAATTSVPPLASLGSIFERLYRIRLSEPAAEHLDEPSSSAATAAGPLQIQMQAAESYQVAESLADLNEDERSRYGAMLAQQPLGASKLNIVDLYPVQLDDFRPNIKANAEERTVFVQPENAAEYRQNLMPNEVAMQPDALTPIPVTTTPGVDFTGKLLAEQDELITEIERKFQLPETTTAASRRRLPQLPQLQPGDSYLDRRVKKSFGQPQPQQPRASDVMALPHIDFANTKFNTDATSLALGGAAGGGVAAPSHPEFSTTKFYNSKELYNEMLLHNKRKLMKEIGTATAAPLEATPGAATATEAAGTEAAGTEAAASGSIIKPSEMPAETTAPGQSSEQPRQVIRPSSSTALPPTSTQAARRVTLMSTAQSLGGTTAATEGAAAAAGAEAVAEPEEPTISSKWSTATPMKRAKLLLKALKPPRDEQGEGQQLAVVAAKIKITTTAAKSSPDVARPSPLANLTQASSKPIAAAPALSRLQEKINSLECDMPNVPQDSHLWRGNETHELLLPNVSPEQCAAGEPCPPHMLTWAGEADIQSGDILIVEINDAQLSTVNTVENYTQSQSAAHAAQVYQVTRSGHEHCDVTEGVLLDITPLVVDGRKLVTLYDKDLTEGVNLLIVVSELWGDQCVRLKVTTKTDNCGENADCSGKGVCYSNGAMEEYECQCCGGFAGPHCEEIDACNPSPCTNNGICVDLSQGHEGNSYQCLCPYGYAGKNCQYESDLCNPAECMNGGSCLGNSTHFRCDCAPGYTGPLCQHSLNECESSPCLHGICVDQEDGFRCFCQPGFAGELCNFEYNECESNPCQNGGECIDHIGSYECRCTKGYTGNRCQIKVDFCANKPCPEGHHCIDHGNDFSCECPGGRNGPDCNQMPRTYFQQCSVNPCTHGGTCWSSGDSFYCACRPGYTGTMCEDEFVVETVVSSSEFIVDDANARNFNDKTFSSSAVLKSPIELHNAYFAAGVLAAAIFIVAIVVTICHCNVNQTYRKFSNRSTSFIPILGFSRRPKIQGTLNKHWLSGKALSDAAAQRDAAPTTRAATATAAAAATQATRHLSSRAQATLGGQLQERPFPRHLAMSMENDMYYTVDFSENSQHLPLIQ